MEYILKACAVITIFYVCYKLFLQRDTFFQTNRWFLLIGLITAFVLPFVVIPIYIEYTPAPIQNFVINETSVIPEVISEPISIWEYIFAGYLIGAALFLIRFCVQISSLAILITKSVKHKKNGYTFVESPSNTAPFSFFRWMVYNPNQFESNELDHIIAHEKVHVKQYHSIDIILSQLAAIVFWFNPITWFYKKDLQQNLEFIADYKAQNSTSCKKSYQHLLLKTSVPNQHMDLTNNFYNSLIKKRIVMLHKSKSKKRNLFKYALVLPFLALFLMSFNTEEVYVEKPATKIETNNIKSERNDKIGVITKDLSDIELNTIKKQLEQAEITVVFSDIKRNEENEIIELTAKVTNHKGSCSATWKNAGNPIPFIEVGETKEGRVISRTVSDYVSKKNKLLDNLNLDKITTQKNQDKKIVETYIIKKNTSDSELEQIKSTIIQKGGKFSYTQNRNTTGEIINLKFEIKNKGTGNFTSEKPFKIVYFGTFFNGGIFISENEKGYQKIIKDRTLKKAHQNIENYKVVITKDFTDADFKRVIKEAREKRITLKFNNIKRNSKNEIIVINAEFKTKKGSGNYNLKGKDPIKSFAYKQNEEGFGFETAWESKFIVGQPMSNVKAIGYGDVKFKEGNKVISSDSIVFTERKNIKYGIPINTDSIYKSPWKVTIGRHADDIQLKENSTIISSDTILFNKDNYVKKDTILKLGTRYQRDSTKQSPWEVSIGENAMDIIKTNNKPLIIIDGKEVPNTILDDIDPNKIESITVLKDAMAISKYGDKGKDGVILITSKNNNSSYFVKGITTKDGKKPLFIIDGKEVKNKTIEDLDPNNIESLTVLKGDKAIEKYGKKGENGVIIIESKKNNEWKTEFIIGHPMNSDKNQEKFIVSGKVTNEEGLGLHGTNILIKGTSRGAETGFDGNYTILVSKGDKLVYSFIGMVSQEVTVNKKTKINVTLISNTIKAISTTSGKDPLYIIDGEKIKKIDLNKIPKDKIESITVLKGDKAIEKYGRKAKDGVVEITTKEKN